MSEVAEVWVVRGYLSLPNDHEAPEIVYSHAFNTRDDAMTVKRRGETELPNIYWALDRMAYANMKFANWVFDMLIEEMTAKGGM